MTDATENQGDGSDVVEGQEEDWRALIEAASEDPPPARTAVEWIEGLGTASQPQKFICGDTALYLVKFANNPHGDGKGNVTEQVVALAGALIGAPVPEATLVEVSAELLGALQLPDFAGPGLHHGSRWAHGYSDRQHLAYVDENRERFGALDILYAWMLCVGDHQWIYRNEPPHEVLSVDHTSFFPGGPAWTAEGLRAESTHPAPDPTLATLNLTPTDRGPALERLRAVRNADLARVVAAPPSEWGISPDERVAVAAYLAGRRDAVLALFGAKEV